MLWFCSEFIIPFISSLFFFYQKKSSLAFFASDFDIVYFFELNFMFFRKLIQLSSLIGSLIQLFRFEFLRILIDSICF